MTAKTAQTDIVSSSSLRRKSATNFALFAIVAPRFAWSAVLISVAIGFCPLLGEASVIASQDADGGNEAPEFGFSRAQQSGTVTPVPDFRLGQISWFRSDARSEQSRCS